MTQKIKHVIKYLIIICSCLLFLASFCININDHDEAFSMGLISHNIKNIIDLDQLDVHPPLYYIFVRLSVNIITFWTSSLFIKVLVARLFSVVCFIIFFYFGIKLFKLYHIKVNIIDLFLLLVISPSIIPMMVRIRMYSMSSMFLILELYELLKFYNYRNIENLLLSFIFVLVNFYTLYVAALSSELYVIIFISLFVYHKNMYSAIKLILCNILVGILYIPWIHVLYTQFMNHSRNNSGQFPKRFLLILVAITKDVINSMSQLYAINHMDYLISIFIVSCMIAINIWGLKTKFNRILFISDFNFAFSIISIIYICRGKFQPAVLYPCFTIYVFLLMGVVITKLNKSNKLLFNIICCIILFMSLGYSCQHMYESARTNSISSIQLINNWSKWRLNKNNVIIDKSYKYPKNSTINIYSTGCQNAVYLRSLDKRYVLKCSNYKMLAKNILNDSKDTNLIKKTFNNVKITNK